MKVVLCSVRPEDVDFFKRELSEFQTEIYTERLEEINIDTPIFFPFLYSTG